jgi:molybdenum cofactor cytidylyltransferase
VKSAGEAAGWIVALADMPYIRPDSIAKVAAALAAGAAIVAPAYQGRRGHPVGLDYAYRRQLEALRGDVGARALIEQNPDSVTLIDVDDPGVCRDIDTPDDLRPNYG